MEDTLGYIRGQAPNFPAAESVGDREWGSENLLCLVSGAFMMKELVVRAGCKGGLQYHRLKNECAILVEGQMIIRYSSDGAILQEKIIGPGDVVHFPPGTVHQEEAITDCRLIECSTPHFNDRVRMEDEFKVGAHGGLPSTQLNDITFK